MSSRVSCTVLGNFAQLLILLSEVKSLGPGARGLRPRCDVVSELLPNVYCDGVYTGPVSSVYLFVFCTLCSQKQYINGTRSVKDFTTGRKSGIGFVISS